MITYKKSGVDIKLADDFVEFLGKKSKAIGGFSGLFPLKETKNAYSIVAATDGVGTKLKLAFLLNKHDTIGIDLVAMCVNDLITCGAKPLFFLDYYATGKLVLKKSKKIMAGIFEGCKQSGMILLGGETAEMPGVYKASEYDLAGFAVGIVKNSEMINGSKIKPGDVLIGLKSTGFHSNGYSLIRKALAKKCGRSPAPELLTPTKIYVRDIDKLKAGLKNAGSVILGLAHITGSGIPGNLERILPKNTDAVVYKNSWKIPDIMQTVQNMGNIPEKDMWSAFNMGIGMIAVIRKKDVAAAFKILQDALIIGEIAAGSQKVIIQ